MAGCRAVFVDVHLLGTGQACFCESVLFKFTDVLGFSFRALLHALIGRSAKAQGNGVPSLGETIDAWVVGSAFFAR